MGGAAAALGRAGPPPPPPAPVPAPAPPALAVQPPTAGAPALRLAAPTAPTPAYASVTSVETAVREARQSGKGEQEVHRLRAASLPAAQVEAISRMEAAETSWRRRVQAMQAACAAHIGCEHARAGFTQEELARASAYAAPTLRQ